MSALTFKRIPADYSLRDKIGTGKLDATTIPAMQRAAKENMGKDVPHLIKTQLAAIKALLDEAAPMSYGREEFLPALSRKVMDVKSLSGMFAFPTICAPASVLLDLLDEASRLDNDVMEIISGFLRLSVRQLEDEKQDTYDAQKLATSIREACKRYQDKAAKNRGE